jgi:sirohydrochlorin cobaltochelatase
MSDIGVMLCGHGSRDAEAVREFQALAGAVAERLPQYRVESGFLEFARPVIADGLDALHRGGVRRILAVPGMLFAAGHVKNDIPSVLNEYSGRHPDIDIRLGRDLAVDTKLTRAAGARIETALSGVDDRVSRTDTLLMVVGRGTSDPDANSNISKVTRLLWEGMGFGWAETAYSGVTFPLVEPALEHAARLGYRRIVVFPYFLFTGVLVKRIYDATARVAARHRDIEFVTAPYLGDHPLVLEAVCDRVDEILTGDGNMNCQLCKYREQVLGFEDEVALPQQGHHHHVEGIGVGTGTGDGNGGHAHGDGNGTHGHHPYPQADHPLGPAGARPGKADGASS